MGLYHTSERETDISDPIRDTPRCAPGQTCPEEFETNLMTPGTGAIRTGFTPGQATVLRRHPACVPLAVL